MENVAIAGFSGMMIDPTDLTNDGLSPWWILCVFKCVAFLLNAPLCKDCTNTTHTHARTHAALLRFAHCFCYARTLPGCFFLFHNTLHALTYTRYARDLERRHNTKRAMASTKEKRLHLPQGSNTRFFVPGPCLFSNTMWLNATDAHTHTRSRTH